MKAFPLNVPAVIGPQSLVEAVPSEIVSDKADSEEINPENEEMDERGRADRFAFISNAIGRLREKLAAMGPQVPNNKLENRNNDNLEIAREGVFARFAERLKRASASFKHNSSKIEAKFGDEENRKLQLKQKLFALPNTASFVKEKIAASVRAGVYRVQSFADRLYGSNQGIEVKTGENVVSGDRKNESGKDGGRLKVMQRVLETMQEFADEAYRSNKRTEAHDGGGRLAVLQRISKALHSKFDGMQDFADRRYGSGSQKEAESPEK
jgi:hypothetical protein